MRDYRVPTRRLEQTRHKVLQVAAPGVPLVIRTGRLVKQVLDFCLIEGRVQLLDTLVVRNKSIRLSRRGLLQRILVVKSA